MFLWFDEKSLKFFEYFLNHWSTSTLFLFGRKKSQVSYVALVPDLQVLWIDQVIGTSLLFIHSVWGSKRSI